VYFLILITVAITDDDITDTTCAAERDESAEKQNTENGQWNVRHLRIGNVNIIKLCVFESSRWN